MADTILPLDETAPNTDRTAFLRIAAFLALNTILGTIIIALTGEKTTFLFKDTMHMTPGDIGTLGIITGIPQYVQPFMGAGADLFPLFGSHRRSYYVLGSLVGALALGGLAYLHQYHYATVVCLLLLISAGGTLASVMVNAIMVAVGNRTGRFSQLQSILFIIPAVLNIVYAANLSGYVTQYWSYVHAFSLGALLSLLGIPLVFLMDEKPSSSPDPVLRRAQRAQSAAVLWQAIRSPGLWAVVGFVSYLIITPGPNYAQVYFMTDVLHFSKQFIGHLGIFGSAGSIIGMALFAFTSRRMPVWVLVWGAWIMDALTYPTLLLLHTPLSGEVLAFTGACVGTWYNLCLLTLAARACPPGTEGTVFGLVMSAIALAGALSIKMGGSLYDFFGPLNKAHHWTITHGWDCSLWIGLGFTLIGFIFIPFLPAWTKSRDKIGDPMVSPPEAA